MKLIPVAFLALSTSLAWSTAGATGTAEVPPHGYYTTDDGWTRHNDQPSDAHRAPDGAADHNATKKSHKEPGNNSISNGNSNRSTNTNKNKNANTNLNSNRNSQAQDQGQTQSVRDSGNSSSRSTGIGIGGNQAQSSVNQVTAGNNNGNVRNAGNNTGNSSSNSSASQTNTNSSTGNSTTTTVEGDTFIYHAQKRNPVASAMAPALASGGNDSCMGSTTMGAQGITFGASFGTTWTDENCVLLKNSTLLWNMDKRDAAVTLMCENPKVRKAMELSGSDCPQVTKKKEEPKQVTVTLDVNDPYIVERVKSGSPKSDRQ